MAYKHCRFCTLETNEMAANIHNNPFSYGRTIIALFRKNPDKKSLQTGHGVTFEEFLKFIIYCVQHNIHLDKHWTPFYLLCNPCYTKFDFLGKLETLQADATHVLQHIGATSGFGEFPSAASGPSSTRGAVNNTAAFRDYYLNIPPDVIRNITQIYQLDFDLFGYVPHIKAYL